MAVINFYDDIFAPEPVHKDVQAGTTIEEAVQSYLDSKTDIELTEVYDLETGETRYVSLNDGAFKIVALSGEKEVGLSYEVSEIEIVSIVLVPEKLDEGAANIVSMIGAIASAAGSILMLVPGGQVFGAILMGVGAGLTLWGGISTYLNNKGAKDESKADSALSSEQNLSLSGGSNQDIVGQRFPFVMGKHLVNPRVVGSSYNITRTKNLNGEDAGSYLRCLYLVGYGPLKISNIKIGSIWAAYNTTPSSEVLWKKNTIMHGILQGYNDEDSGDILKKWKNNDLKIEILQKGDFALSDADRYGDLYSQVCRQTEVGANLLNIKDKEIGELANRVYKGVSILNGFKNNSVYFSGSCPKRIEVELNFPNGLYATRVHSDDGNSNNLYYNLPVRIAVQWRFVRKGQKSSDADEPYDGGWKDFTSVEFTDGSQIRPQTYTLGQMMYDYNSSLGTTGYKDSGWFNLDNPATYNGNKWLGRGKTFNFGCEDVDSPCNDIGGESTRIFYVHTTGGELIKVSETAFKNIVGNFSERTYEYNLTSIQYSYVGRYGQVSTTVSYKDVLINGKEYKCDYAKWGTEAVLNMPSVRDCGITNHAHGVNDFKNNYGVNERSYVASYELTDEECRELINYDGGDVDTDSVEVRVLRVNPSYFDETQDSVSEWSNMSYQDFCKWKYLRTFSFDKDAFKEKLDEVKAAGGDITSVHASDYPQRPLSKEDMDKFALIAVSLKQDAAETGGQSLAQISCIAESFCPNCLENEDGGRTWVPEKISKTDGYYHRYKIEKNGKLATKIEKASSEAEIAEYKNQIANHADGYYKFPDGNDFTDLIKAELFADENKVETPYDTTQWILPDNIEYKYVTNNTASVFALALVGKQMGIDAKTYDDINMEALTDFYEFCSDLTDGTPADSSTVPDISNPKTLKHFFMACNGVVSSEVKTETLLQKILATGRASLKRDDWNRYEVVIGRKQDYPVLLLNQQNVLSYSNTRSFDTVPSGLQIQFIDESDNYSQNDVFVMADGEDYKNPTKEIEGYSFQYVTNREQIWTLGRFNLGCRTMQRETYTRTVGKCGYLLSYGDMVLMADPTLVIGSDCGARIQKIISDSKKIYGFITDEPFEYKTGGNGETQMGVTVLQSKRGGRSRTVTLRLADSKVGADGKLTGPGVLFTNIQAPEASIDYYTDKGLATYVYAQNKAENGGTFYQMTPGLTNVVILRNPVSIDDETSDETSLNVYVKPSVDDIVAFGTYNEITQKAIITAVKPKDKEQFDLTLVPYDESLYEQGTVMAEFRSHMANVSRDSELAEFSDSASQSDVNATAVNVAGNINKAVADIQTTIESLYSNHIVTLYRESDKHLERADVPTETGTYSFKDNSFKFTKDGKKQDTSNSWSLEYPYGHSNTVYVTSATAFGQLPTDDIEPSEWAAPIPAGMNGVDGYNTRTISLYMRLDAVPSSSMLPDEVKYTFATSELTGNLGNWSKDIPPLTARATCLYEIHATALSTGAYDFIEKDEWSAPVKISDGITAETVKQVLDQNPNLLAGNVIVYCSGSVLAFAVDDKGLAMCDQTASVSFSVKQQNVDLDFTFGKFPEIEGVTYSINAGTLAVKVKKGTFLAFQNIPVSLVYREFIELNYYADEDGELYLDENGEPYFIYSYKDEPTTYTFTCSLLPQKGGRQRTDCLTDKDADSLKNLVLGDYFCFTGESTDRFKKGEVYIWTGEEWIVDTYSPHIMACLSSILETNAGTMAEKSKELTKHLAENGEYLEKLLSADNTKFIDEICANDAYIKKLVAQDSFIDTLTANSVFADKLTANEGFVKAFSADTAVIQSLYGNQAFLNKISAGLVKVTGSGTLYDTMTQADEQMFETSKTYAEEQAEEKRREAVINGLKALGLDATVTSNETEILPGYINTDLINVDALVIGNASIEKTDDSGKVVYKTDADGNLVLDSDGNPVPETVKLSESISSMSQKIYRAGAYQPLYYRTNNRITPAPPTSEDEIVNDDVLGKWTTKESKRKVTYTYVCYRYRSPDDGTFRYTGVSCDAATIISGGKIVTSLIDVTSLFAQDITLNPNGYIQSSNYRESGGSPASGFKIDAKSGTIKSYGMVAKGGTFSQVTVSGTLILDVKTSIPSNLVDGEMFLYQSN